MTQYYSMDAVNTAVQTLTEDYGYFTYVIPGVLLDTYICVPDSDDRYIYEFRETYLNCWSSAYTVRRHGHMSKRLEKMIKAAYQD